jgi:hypothetical protein
MPLLQESFPSSSLAWLLVSPAFSLLIAIISSGWPPAHLAADWELNDLEPYAGPVSYYQDVNDHGR